MLIKRLYCNPKIEDMEYTRIVAITGMPGLYEVLSSKTDGALVRSLEDKSTRFVSSRVHNMSHLESIEVYTDRDNVQLSEVFQAMKSSKVQVPDLKDNNAIKSYFEKVYPQLDFERVYASDMKKMLKWYSILDAQDIDFTIQEEVEEEQEAEVEAKPAKAARTSKAARAADTEDAGETEEAPKPAAKKPAPKKAAAKKTASKSGEAATGAEKPKTPRKKKEE